MINSFSGKWRVLSNFYPIEIIYEGNRYTSVEHAFQAAKTLDPVEKIKVQICPTPGMAKRIGKNVTLRTDWEQVKVSIMLELLRQKFSVIPKILLSTEDQELVEGNTWNDHFWGVCNGMGENMLGKLLMQVRGELRAESK